MLPVPTELQWVETRAGERILVIPGVDQDRMRRQYLAEPVSSPELSALLQVLLELDEEFFANIYNIERGSTAPLDEALYAWRDSVLNS